MQHQIIELLQQTKRPGINQLLNFLVEGTDFFTAPASTKYHGAYAGGLAEHSLGVYNVLQSFAGGKYPEESIIICGLMHDICKVNFYKQSTRNVKNEHTGQWEKVSCYTIEDSFPMGHGEKSVITLMRFIQLHEHEMYAIRWHMGGYDDAARGGYGGGSALSAAFEKCPLAVMLHMADLVDTYLKTTAVNEMS